MIYFKLYFLMFIIVVLIFLLNSLNQKYENFNNNQKIGFIILRYVNSKKTNKLWIKSYDCVRKFYPRNKIIIIDDNSDYKFITAKKLYNTKIINSEFPRRGELLPYYYYLNNNFFDTAVIIHDSVFINKKIDFDVDNYMFIWEFDHKWDNIKNETKLIKLFNDKELLKFYNSKHLWKGCFGAMSIINHDYLELINKKYNISKLLNHIKTREQRMAFERIIACILQIHFKKKSLLGNIHKYCKWGIKYNKVNNYNHLPIIKVWSGR